MLILLFSYDLLQMFLHKQMLIYVPVSITEWDLGGFPAWLLAVKPPLKLRTADPAYLELVSYHHKMKQVVNN